jgi:hypothetical protein
MAYQEFTVEPSLNPPSNIRNLIGQRFGRLIVTHYHGTANLRAHSTTHGMADTSLYKRWVAIKRRTANPKDRNYPQYGGRGVRICDG